MTRRLKRCPRRRQAIEPVIGHLKQDGWLGRNWLKGVTGDHLNMVLSCAGHKLRLILRRVRFFRLRARGLFGGRHGDYPVCRAEIPALPGGIGQAVPCQTA